MQKPAGLGEALAGAYPGGITIAVVKDAAGKYNPITLGLFMQTSGDPPLFAIAMAPERYSFEALRASGQFVLGYPSVGMAREALYFGTHSGRDIDKLAACGTKIEPAAIIDGVLLSDAIANLECVLESELETGDHVIFVGRVVAAHANIDPSVKWLQAIGPDYKMGSAESRPMPQG
jgi:flavin reductase (DIM6/NTAB) family NADH-FMN oxidoreductase RutF